MNNATHGRAGIIRKVEVCRNNQLIDINRILAPSTSEHRAEWTSPFGLESGTTKRWYRREGRNGYFITRMVTQQRLAYDWALES